MDKDPRVLRQITALKEDHSITTCGISKSNIEGVREIPILFRPSKNQAFFQRVLNFIKMKTNRFDRLTWNNKVFEVLKQENFEIVIVSPVFSLADT